MLLMWKILRVNIVLLLKATGDVQDIRQGQRKRGQSTSLILRKCLDLFRDICLALMLSGNRGAVPAQCALGKGTALNSCLPRLLAHINLIRRIGSGD